MAHRLEPSGFYQLAYICGPFQCNAIRTLPYTMYMPNKRNFVLYATNMDFYSFFFLSKSTYYIFTLQWHAMIETVPVLIACLGLAVIYMIDYINVLHNSSHTYITKIHTDYNKNKNENI